MRIVGYIEHPQLKITVFRMDNRTSVKIENTLYEQTYKLGQDERFNDLESIKKLLNAGLLEQTSHLFQQMHQSRLTALSRAFPQELEETFETII
jgi:hypothetical protein